jgi:hypothetical protein
VFVEGEDLVYNVRYGFIDLGQVRIRIVGTVRGKSSPAFEAKAIIDSYPKVPFVDLHAIYESLIDSGMFSRRFLGRQKENGEWDFSRYNFDYPDKRVLIEVGTHDSVVVKRDTLAVGTAYHDGLSLFFYARAKLFSGLKVNVPTVIKEQKVSTSTTRWMSCGLTGTWNLWGSSVSPEGSRAGSPMTRPGSRSRRK